MTLYLGRTAVNATLAVGGGNVDDVQVDGVSVVTNKVAEIDLTGKQDVISDLSTIRSGATAGATAVQPGDLATVATSGSYNDLDDKPTIPAAQVNSDWNSSSGVSQILNKPTLGTMAAENTTSYYTKTELDGKLNSAMHFKGTKARVADLPSSGQEVGDMWNVQSTGANYAWDGENWDKLSENIDLSGLQPNLTSSNAGTGISITGSGSNVVISNTQTSAEWGNITGTLSNQTDLQTALGNKANDSEVVKLTGNQTIAGTKTFSNSELLISASYPKFVAKDTGATRGTYNSSQKECKVIFRDGNDKTLAETRTYVENSDSATSYCIGVVTENENNEQVYKTLYRGTTHKNGTSEVSLEQANSIYFNNNFYIKNTDADITDTTNTYNTGIIHYRDKNGIEYFYTKAYQDTNRIMKEIGGYYGTNTWKYALQAGYDRTNDKMFARIPSPSTSDNSTQIATTAFVKAQGYVTSSGTVEKSNSVINQRDSSTAIKTWTGTKAQYDAIVTKDPNTLYSITDDTDVSLTILEALYPVGSIYITTAANCPLSALISGSTWELVSSGRVLQGADNDHSAGTTIEAGLPNITGDIDFGGSYGFDAVTGASGAFTAYNKISWRATTTQNTAGSGAGLSFSAQDSNSIYGNSSTVQPPAYVVNIFRRTA